uniref:Retrotransposon gag domain-containing protein n=1 Tax=Tanacetum cinerariifolium TaxID=118510 RepID=A0A6L2KE87_TANCI|nr:hypothetical protein [Tanacetum cinerariifolium]
MEDDVDINTLTMEQYLAWVQDEIRPGVVKPKIGNNIEFEININFMRELRHKLFKGTNDEDAYKHVRRVLEIADLFHFPGVIHDVVMLRVFPITLKGPTLRWINRLSARLDTTWDILKKAFIREYCPPFKTAKKLEIICNFKQEMDETLYHAWERILDSGGFILLMTPTQALKSIQIIGEHSHNWYDETTTSERINDSSDNIDAIKQEDKGNTDDDWDITVKDVDRLRQILIPTIHTLPNLEPMVQPYMPLGLIHDKEKVVREEEHDYDIPLQDGVMQPLTPQMVHIIPLDDDYVAPGTNPILNKHLNEFGEKFSDNTRVSKKIDSNPVTDLKELLKT